MTFAATDPLSALIGSAGTAGIVVVMLVMGYLHTRPAMEREQKVADAELARRQALIDTLLAVYHHEVLPTLGDIDRRLVPMMERTEKMLTQVEWLFGQLERRSGATPDTYFRSRSGEAGLGGGFGQSPGSGPHPPDPPRP